MESRGEPINNWEGFPTLWATKEWISPGLGGQVFLLSGMLSSLVSIAKDVNFWVRRFMREERFFAECSFFSGASSFVLWVANVCQSQFEEIWDFEIRKPEFSFLVIQKVKNSEKMGKLVHGQWKKGRIYSCVIGVFFNQLHDFFERNKGQNFPWVFYRPNERLVPLL